MAKQSNPKPSQKKMKNCPACSGTGNCSICKGKGTREPWTGGKYPCVRCNETGKCTRCRGKGVVPAD